MKPTIGRIVHYIPQHEWPEHIAGIVTRIDGEGLLALTIFPKGQPTMNVQSVPFSEDPKIGTWHWPERED